MTTTPDVTRTVLEERARVLARRAAPADDSGNDLFVLGFTVSGRAHAIEITSIREVLGECEVTRLPWAPPAVAGVTNIRGQVAVVADAGLLLGTGATAAGSPAVVLDAGGRVFALRVDTVDDVARLPLSALVPVEGDAATARSHLVSALTASTLVVDATALVGEIGHTFGPQEDT